MLVFLYVAVNIFFIAFVTKVPPVSTEKKYLAQIFEQVRITPQTVIYDLGCGHGNFLIEAAKFRPKKCVGYELSLWPYLKAKFRAKFEGRGRVKVVSKDFFKADLGDANVVYVYLVPPLLVLVSEKLKHELRPGATVLVKGSPLPGIKYINKICLDDRRDYWLYVYKF